MNQKKNKHKLLFVQREKAGIKQKVNVQVGWKCGQER